jgi:DNA-directed RNA polymerase specialized sigma subunit
MDAADYYEERLDELQAEIATCVRYIEGIEDTQMHMIMSMRYVQGMSWTQIARRMKGVSPDSIRMLHNRVLGKMDDEPTQETA